MSGMDGPGYPKTSIGRSSAQFEACRCHGGGLLKSELKKHSVDGTVQEFL